MNPIIKGAIAFGTVVGTGGAGYGIYSAMKQTPEKVKSYAEELEGTLLTATDDSQKSNWESRLASLQGIDSINKLVTGLQGLKDKKSNVQQWKELRAWCQNIVKTPSKDKQDQEFQNIQSYCTFSIKEQVSKPIGESEGDTDAKWLSGHQELEKIPDSELDETLKADKKKTDEDQKKAAIKAWCTASYKKPYKGPKDQDFKNASRICKS